MIVETRVVYRVGPIWVIMLCAVACLGISVWGPDQNGNCGHVAVFDPSGEDGCTVQWQCSGTHPSIVCRRGYQPFNEGVCHFRPTRTHSFGPAQCYWEPLFDDYLYGCIYPVSVTPVYGWEAHPDNPVNCQPPEYPPYAGIFDSGFCPAVNDHVEIQGSAWVYCNG